MRILFTTEYVDAVSTVINIKNFRRLGDLDDVVFSEFDTDFAGHDVILFMGYDPQIAQARVVNPSAAIGVVDVRPPQIESVRDADFIVSNGPEMTAMASRYFNNVFEYAIYPEVPPRSAPPSNNDRLVVCYHGNKAHAVAMFPQVTMALEELAKEVPIELRLIYNHESLGLIPERYLPKPPVMVRTVQWHENVYSEELAGADIGIVPNLTPMRHAQKAMDLTTPKNSQFGAQPSEMLVRYKPTSNPGRILAFAQHGIPVIADMYPSASQLIHNDVSGYLVHGAASWYQALRNLCLSGERREAMGAALQRIFIEQYTVEGMNKRFAAFCAGLGERHQAPASLMNATMEFEKNDRSDKTALKMLLDRLRGIASRFAG